jgi:hypothetical protein
MHAYWEDDLPYREFENFMWDTLEEWSAIELKQEQLYTHKERIFWHLFHETQYVTAEKLKHDSILKDEVSFCLEYLQNDRACPLDVVGMRP